MPKWALIPDLGLSSFALLRSGQATRAFRVLRRTLRAYPLGKKYPNAAPIEPSYGPVSPKRSLSKEAPETHGYNPKGTTQHPHSEAHGT